MQYFQPKPGYFVGDCMPYFHEGIFQFFYLIDQDHHQGLGGYGGHQWAQASSRDLINWEHHPLAIPIAGDAAKSICTGSVFFHDGIHYAFYAQRMEDWSQHIGLAVSRDGIHFKKTQPNPVLSAPPDIARCDFRDPFIFEHDGLFHMLITAKYEKYPLEGRGGFVMRMTSPDLKEWTRIEEPFFVSVGSPGYDSIPECPDYFFWNGWYYLVFGSSLRTHYRMSKTPMGPWLRPRHDMLGSARNAVMKTAWFGDNRRIGASWIGSRRDDKDDGDVLWGGNALFREIVQNPDGTLGTSFPEEMIPKTGAPMKSVFHPLTSGVQGNSETVTLTAPYSQEAGCFENMPPNFRLRCVVTPSPDTRFFGLGFRGMSNYGPNYDLRFEYGRERLTLRWEAIQLEGDLQKPRQLDVVVTGDIIDVCLDGRQTLANRCPELKGDRLFFFCENGSVRFDEIDIRPLL